jgi:hexosaminidase
VIGLECCLWTETIQTQDNIDNMMYPRLLAAGEIGWSAQNRKDLTDFLLRVESAPYGHLKRLDTLGVKYSPNYMGN